MTLGAFVMAGLGIALCLIVLVLLVEVSAHAFKTTHQHDASAAHTPSYVVLIPAHNEADVIEDTVRQATRQLSPVGRLLVVADNCTDNTADIAREAGAEVVERVDPRLRAKGYALAHGIAHLRGAAAPQALIVMDADCRAGDGTFDMIARQTVSSMRPVQSINLMVPNDGAKLGLRMAAFAWAVRNHVRPAGLANLSLPCQLTGTGMAFAWPLLDKVNFATGSLVEDSRLGLEFAVRRSAPMLNQNAVVTSKFAESREGQDSQRRRWEHGQMDLIFRHTPQLLWEAVRHRNFNLFVMVCDMCVPPLALLALGTAVYAALGVALAAWSHVGMPAAVLGLTAAFAFAFAVGIGWHTAGRRWVSASELLSIPLYVLRKVPLYLGFVTNRQQDWTRTKRGQ